MARASTNNDLFLTAQAVDNLLRGTVLEEPVPYEQFGAYHDLVWQMNLMAAIDSREVQRLWARVQAEVPQLAILIQGFHAEGLIEPKDLFTEMKDWYDHGIPRGVSPGWPSLAQSYRVMPGESTVITGAPSSGKSRFISAMMVNIGRSEDWHTLMISPEMMPVKRHMEILLTQYVGKPFALENPKRMSWPQAEEGLQWLQEHFTWLWPKGHRLTIPFIIEMSKHSALLRGTKAVVLDPWNRLSHKDRKQEAAETAYIGECLDVLFEAAQTFNYHQFIIAHPTKIFKDASTGKYPVVTPNMISGSANWWSMPDGALSIRRDLGNDEDNKTEVHIQKARWDENGRMGRCVDLYYHQDTRRYSEVVSVSMPYMNNGRGRDR